MSQNANAKQRQKMQATKSQIQLLKQKYLRKNLASPNVQKSKEEVTQKSQSITQVNVSKAFIKEQNKKQIQPISIDRNSNEKIQITSASITEQNKLAQWSLKDFLQRQNQSNQPAQVKRKQNIDIQSATINLNDPFCLSQYFKYPLPSQDISPSVQMFEMQREAQIITLNPKLKSSQQKDLSIACKIWIQSPQKALHYLYSTSNQSFQLHAKTLILTSRNPNFPGIVQQLAEHFIFNNSIVLKDGQKQVVFNMALEYFCPSPSKLSDILIVCLIKIMPLYATVYIDEIIRKIGYYMQKIISYKKYLLKQELDIFINCLQQRIQSLRVDGVELPNQTFCWILIVKPTSNYCNQVLLTRVIDNQKQLLTIFCSLYPENKQSSISILYLKCIDSLISTFVRTGILQKVISHLNEIKVSEILYQPVKSLKLKLIRAADTGKDRKKVEEDKGFVNFLNEKISRFKDSLESKVSLKPKADLIYNFATQRYQPIVRPES